MYTKREENIIKEAKGIVGRVMGEKEILTSSTAAIDYFTLHTADLEHEVFSVAFLNSQHRVICVEQLFKGTIDGAAVYPREVIKRALAVNAAAICISHNHPSHSPEPSQADINITRKIKYALDTVDIRLIDHILVAGNTAISFASSGLI